MLFTALRETSGSRCIMIGKRKIIGLCVTKLNNRTHADYVNRMHYVARSHGFRLVVFNSSEDFYRNDSYSDGAKTIFEDINFQILDGIIIHSDHFYDKELVRDIAQRAKDSNVPVVVTDMEIEGCYSIVKEYEDAYKDVIRHVIKDHGITDTFFMAGKKGDGVSEQRIQYYKDVLEENGLEFSEDRVGYGEYWHFPTHVVVNDLIADGKKPPRAIICANDFMAIATCEKLAEEGYKIPDDVIVTGFDGVPDGDYFNPKLTTCKEDIEQLINLSVELIEKAINENLPCGVFKENYVPCIAESCGCTEKEDDMHSDAGYIFHVMQEMENHENFMYTHLDKMIECYDMGQLLEMMSDCILPNSYVCIKSDFAASAELLPMDRGIDVINGYAVVPAKDNRNVRINDIASVSRAGLMPDVLDWAEGDYSAYVLSAIYADNELFGCYAVRAYELFTCAHQINRINRIINIAVNSALSHSKQRMMEQSIEKASMLNSVTGLPNLKGAAKWFEEFASKPENHDRIISVSVYALPKYRYIYENYGIKDIEDALVVVAENLGIANPEKCFIAHISEDEFIIINYLDDDDDLSETINNATSSFFGNLGKFNDRNVKEYFVEVNCGCTVAYKGWDETLANFIRLARGEMYINRVKSGMGDAVKEQNSSKEFYDAFSVLVEKNLFSYYFQPIVNAKNGEIYAYEALMRTDPSIGMNPLQVLETAGAYKRLYDIERATMFNVMGRFAEDFEKFGGRKVFINSIPGHFLNENDNKALSEKYAEFMKYFVFEITELNSISDDELDSIRFIGKDGSENEIAIDDYGTGHSNIVNLLRYSPHIVKIDRFLITDIHKDVNKQMFVRSTIEFARLNGIKVLAEGVETSDEMRTVIDFGVDYIQGYYTGRPAPDPIAEINPEIRDEILKANPLFANQN